MYIHSPEAQFLNKHHGWFPKVCFSIAFYHGVFKADLQPRFSFCCKPSSALSTQQVVASLSDPEIKIGAGYFPRATRLLDGSLLGVYSSFSSGSTTLKTIISKDAGASWQPLGSIAGEVTNTTDLDNPFVVQLPSGRIPEPLPRSRYSSLHLPSHHMSYPDDNGTSWTYLSEPAAQASPINGIWEAFLRNALDCSLQLYCSCELAGNDQGTIQRFTSDGGETWTAPCTIS